MRTLSFLVLFLSVLVELCRAFDDPDEFMSVKSDGAESTSSYHSLPPEPKKFASKMPSAECALKYKDLIDNARYVTSGQQGSIYKSFDPSLGVDVALKIAMPFDDGDSDEGQGVPKTSEEEALIMEELSKFMFIGKTKGFVRMYRHFKCGQIYRERDGKIRIDKFSNPSVTYIVMEWLTSSIDEQLMQPSLTMEQFGAYLLQTLMTLAVVRSELGFVGRDLPDSIMIFTDPSLKSYTDHSKFGFVLPDQSRILIPKVLTGGRYTKLIDVGQSKIAPYDGRVIDTLAKYPEFDVPKTNYFEGGIDLIAVLDDFITKTPQHVFEKFKADDSIGYGLLLHLLKSALGPTMQSLIAMKRVLHLSPFKAKFIDAWKEKQHGTAVVQFTEWCKTRFAPVDRQFSLIEAVNHPFFKHLFAKYDNAGENADYLTKF